MQVFPPYISKFHILLKPFAKSSKVARMHITRWFWHCYSSSLPKVQGWLITYTIRIGSGLANKGTLYGSSRFSRLRSGSLPMGNRKFKLN
jgi:hypothetical protein